eukprot:CAMPEP_0114350550 /NCGR_PEP_ID=MMETSP0101-20121206/16460_1 /TAXON_ID=38822 ORGANISM="Pteridomonas danica, Strain PT" /NCGR_SAMPLE_ID=MMETSP0101 /ASSEMBLY_ACC=CAM_ASM_000211 /LENGTH=115 /DNA_ID=CAMNT_0001489867 /DNA_START=54 /DNA_END=401 /DNA_ORIENTATION=-
MRFSSVLTLFSMIVVGVMGGANEPIADNVLGTTAMSCATTYCTDGKDGLRLWLEMTSGCSGVESKYSLSSSSETKTDEVQKTDSTTTWSPTAVGSISAIMAVVGVVMGFVSGMGM